MATPLYRKEDRIGPVTPDVGKSFGVQDKGKAALPVGNWRIEFSNGVIESCGVGRGGQATVDEPLRQAKGTAEVQEGSIVIRFTDNRVERWTPIGNRYVVEHWYPATRVPTVSAVLGIAERVRE
jgi:hypothetical protein